MTRPSRCGGSFSFLGACAIQYSSAILILPVDLPLNLLLKETQVPHRSVTHTTAEMKIHTRMQVRVLDHARLLAGNASAKTVQRSAVVERARDRRIRFQVSE